VETSTAGITTVDGIIPAVGKHIVSEQALAGGDEGICVEESAPGGVVVAGLEVIEACLWDNLVAMRPFLPQSWRLTSLMSRFLFTPSVVYALE